MFFRALGLSGLSKLFQEVLLNTFTNDHPNILTTDEGIYFTAAYDFFLQEHHHPLVQELLTLLSLPFLHAWDLMLLAELYAICAAIVKACSLPDVNSITLFTDSIASARRAVNPSVHSGQGHSLAVCRALEQWFANGGRSVTFVMVHSRFEWGPHHEAHEFIRGLPPVGGRHMATSLDSLRKKATTTCLDSWSTMFQNEKYRGHNFLLLQNLDGGIVQPTYAKGGSWLGEVGGRLSVATRMCRSILGHAPIGSYFQRFNIDESHWCECGVPLQTRDHIFVACKKHKLLHGDCRVPKYIGELWYFLDTNPKAFAQRTPGPPPEGVG